MAEWGNPLPGTSLDKGTFLGGQIFGVNPGGEFRENGYHDGLDFGSVDHAGTDIHAVHAGTIKYTGNTNDNGAGNYIVIHDDTNNLDIVYQEFTSTSAGILVKVGDKVNLGDVIGKRNTDHLHLGITTKDWKAAYSNSFSSAGGWLDPLEILTKGYNGKGGAGSGGSDTGGGGNTGGGSSTPSTPQYQMLKVNQFNCPIVKERYIQLMNEDEKGALPKYMYLREAFNRNMKKDYPDHVERINSLQGPHGLEKLFTAPFTVLTLTNGKGAQSNFNIANFKNQKDPFKVNIQGFLGKANKVEFYCQDYLTYLDTAPTDAPNRQGEAGIRKDSLMDTTPKNFDFVVDASKSYEFLNQNRIKQSQDNAQFALSTNKIQNDNSTRNFQLDQGKQTHLNQIAQANQRQQLDITQQGQWAQQATGVISAAPGILANAATGNIGEAFGGVGGLIMDEANMGLKQHFANQSLAANQGAANQALATNQNAATKTYHNNLTTSQLIASNTYDNAIANINAGLNDIKNQPDISAVSGADYNFEMAWNNDDVWAITYTANPQALVSIAEYFAQFGYAINRYGAVTNYTRVRPKFNYIKTKGANIKGNINNKWRNALNMIFDNGITLWQDPDAMRIGSITENYKK